MFKFFKKRVKTIKEHLTYSVKKPDVNFQLDIIRTNNIEIQIARQRMVMKLGVEIKCPEGFSLSFDFNTKPEEDYQRFLKSDLYDKAQHVEKHGKAYFLLCDNSLEDVLKLLRGIQTKVFNYKDDTVFGYRYIKHK